MFRIRIRAISGLALWLCASAVFGSPGESTAVSTGGVSAEFSAQETLLGLDGSAELRYFPDTVVVRLSSRPTRLLMTVGTGTHLFEGEDLRSLRRVGLALGPGGAGAFDSGYAGICGAYRGPSGRIYAAYHAEDQTGMAETGPGVPGYYAQVGWAVSRDGGASFEKLGVVLQSRQEKDPRGLPDQGAGEACLTLERGGRFLLLYYVDHSRIEGRGVQICLARAELGGAGEAPPLDGWRKRRGGRFTEPGLGGLDTPVMSGASAGADATFPHVVWVEALRRYAMFYNLNVWREYAGADAPMKPLRSGVYLSFSEDGLVWSDGVRVVRAFSVAVPFQELAWHPTLLLDAPDAASGWLLYGYSSRWSHAHQGGDPHYLVGRRVRFSAQ